MNARINCVIPGCRRGTTKFPESDEIICYKHWRCLPVATKRRRRAIDKEIKRLDAILEKYPDFTPDERRQSARADRMLNLNWRLAKRQATFAAAGI